MNTHDFTFLTMMHNVLHNGDLVPNRTGVDTISLLGFQCRYDLRKGFPVLCSKRVAWKHAVREMLWFISGSTNINDLGEARHIWERWADRRGELGPVYGRQWRKWDDGTWSREGLVGFDQLNDVVQKIKAGSDSRRLIVTAWQPSDVDQMALPPCHVLYQFTVRNGVLHLHLYQRSCDLPIGGPFNVCQYAALLMMVAKLANLEAGELIHSIHDAHIYVNQVDAVKQWLDQADSGVPSNPWLKISGEQATIDDFKIEDFQMYDYSPNPSISIPVTV